MRCTDLPQQIQKLIAAARYGVLATVCKDGQPWNTPVSLAIDDDLNVYWGSAYDSQHSRNLAANPSLFLVIFGDEHAEHNGIGLYMSMRGQTLTTPWEITKAKKFYDTTFFETYRPDVSFLGDCPTRLYKAKPERIWHNINEIHDGYYIDVRSPLA
jgi:general stress protein 26